MFNMFKQVFTKFFPTEKKIMLGRWNINYNNDYIKGQLANFDNCGDKICKKPSTIIKHINIEKKNYKK